MQIDQELWSDESYEPKFYWEGSYCTFYWDSAVDASFQLKTYSVIHGDCSIRVSQSCIYSLKVIIVGKR